MKHSADNIGEDEKLLIQLGRGESEQTHRWMEGQRHLTPLEIQKIVNENPECKPLQQMIVQLKSTISRMTADKQRDDARYRGEIQKLEAIERSLSSENRRLKKENAALQSK